MSTSLNRHVLTICGVDSNFFLERMKSYLALTLTFLIWDSNANSTANAVRRQLQFDEPLCRNIDQDQIYKCPVKRYCPWDSFSDTTRQFLRSQLLYTRRKWNYDDRINEDIENVKFDDINITRQEALRFLGFDQSSHDCCHSHYKTYDWNDFTEEFVEVKRALELIGYNETNWERRGDDGFYTLYDGMLWDDLPLDVRVAAQKSLCFNKEIWNKIDLSMWDNETIIPGSVDKTLQAFTETPDAPPFITTSPSIQQIETDTLKPSAIDIFRSESISPSPSTGTEMATNDSVSLSLSPSFVPSPLIIEISYNDSTTPTSSPSTLVTSNPSEYKTTSPSSLLSTSPSATITPEPTFNPTIQVTPYPTFADGIIDACHRLHPKIEYFCPIKRYCEWSYYDFANRQYLRFQIGYDRSSWNYYTTLPYENTAFVFLPTTVQNGLTAFAGYDEDSYDCCQGHYNDYDWNDFEDESYEEVKQSLTILGYDQVKWDGGAAILYDELEWNELPPDIQESLEDLCYTKETWDRVPLDLWPRQAKLPGQYEKKEEELSTISPSIQPPMLSFPTSAPCRELEPNEEYWCPVRRYCEWDHFEFRDRQVLTFQLGYTESDWNYDDTNTLESKSFDELSEYVQRGLMGMGYNEDKHDCCLNHYMDYSWDELSTLDGLDDVKAAFEMIGYNEKKWDDGESSDFDDYYWDELPNEVRATLYSSLCYNRELWDQIPLTVWPEHAILPTGLENPYLEVSAARTNAVWKSFIVSGLISIIINRIF